MCRSSHSSRGKRERKERESERKPPTRICTAAGEKRARGKDSNNKAGRTMHAWFSLFLSLSLSLAYFRARAATLSHSPKPGLSLSLPFIFSSSLAPSSSLFFQSVCVCRAPRLFARIRNIHSAVWQRTRDSLALEKPRPVPAGDATPFALSFYHPNVSLAHTAGRFFSFFTFAIFSSTSLFFKHGNRFRFLVRSCVVSADARITALFKSVFY